MIVTITSYDVRLSVSVWIKWRRLRFKITRKNILPENSVIGTFYLKISMMIPLLDEYGSIQLYFPDPSSDCPLHFSVQPRDEAICTLHCHPASLHASAIRLNLFLLNAQSVQKHFLFSCLPHEENPSPQTNLHLPKDINLSLRLQQFLLQNISGKTGRSPGSAIHR